MLKTPETLAWIASLFADANLDLVFHNAKFDLKMFVFEGIQVFEAKAKVHCTLILAKLINSMLWDYSLEALAKKFLARDTRDKTGVTEWLKAHRRAFEKEHGRKPGFHDAPLELVKARNLWDVQSTLILFQFFLPTIRVTCGDLYETERELQFVVLDMEHTGVRVDITHAKLLRAQAKAGVEELKRELVRLCTPLEIKRARCCDPSCKKGAGKKGNKKGIKPVFMPEDVPSRCPVCGGPVEIFTQLQETFNPQSPHDVPAAFVQLGIPLRYKTKPKKPNKSQKRASGGGNWCFDEYAMIRYVSPVLGKVIRDSGESKWPIEKFHQEVLKCIRDNDLEPREMLPPLILKYRELSKMSSTYYDHLIEDCVDITISPDGRETGTLHCHFNQVEAKTGRFSSSGPNLQNMPRILGPRECFIPFKSRVDWHFDYEQVEMKLFCHFAQDPDMAAAIEQDIHLYVAAEIYGIPVEKITKEQRKRAKAINFGIIYGSGPEKVAETLTRMGLHTSKAEARKLFARYHRRFPSVRRTTKQLQVQLMRKGFVTNPFGRRYYIPRDKGYRCLNYLCQGTSAELIKRGMVKVWKFLREGGYKAKILLQVHDEIKVSMPRSEQQELVPKIIELLEDRTSFFVPITVDAECVTRRWSQKKKAADVGIILQSKVGEKISKN